MDWELLVLNFPFSRRKSTLLKLKSFFFYLFRLTRLAWKYFFIIYDGLSVTSDSVLLSAIIFSSMVIFKFIVSKLSYISELMSEASFLSKKDSISTNRSSSKSISSFSFTLLLNVRKDFIFYSFTCISLSILSYISSKVKGPSEW